MTKTEAEAFIGQLVEVVWEDESREAKEGGMQCIILSVDDEWVHGDEGYSSFLASIKRITPVRRGIPWREDRVDQFWWFVTERHNVYRRRFEQKLPPPWTEDSVLQTYRFTNVYRELDKGSQYLINNILGTSLTADLTVFNVFAYRRFNLPATHDALVQALCGGRNQSLAVNEHFLTHWDRDLALDCITKRKAAGHPIQSPAWVVNASGVEGPGSGLKLQCDRISHFWTIKEEVTEALLDAPSMEEAWKLFTLLPGIGGFVAYEMVIDLNYPGGILDFSEDDFVNPGPGCVQGIDLMTEVPVRKRARYIEAIRDLRETQEEPLRKYGHVGKPFTLRNVEQALCEYRKWLNCRNGGRHKRKYP